MIVSASVRCSMNGMDGMGYTVGTGVATAQKIVQRPTTFLPGLHLLGWQGYSKEQSPPRSRVNRRVHTDRSRWNKMNHGQVVLQLVGHFHFLNISEERHSDVWAKGSNFLPVVERSKVGLSEDEKSFSHTQFACFGDWIERLPSVQNLPIHFPCGVSWLTFPDVCAQDIFVFVVMVVERLLVVSEPGLELSGAPHVLLHLLLPELIFGATAATGGRVIFFVSCVNF